MLTLYSGWLVSWDKVFKVSSLHNIMGSFINDVTHLGGGEGVSVFVTKCDRGGRGGVESNMMPHLGVDILDLFYT